MTDYTKEAEELYPYKKYENLRKGIIYNTIIDSYREAHIAARQQSAAEIDRLRGEVERLTKTHEFNRADTVGEILKRQMKLHELKVSVVDKEIGLLNNLQKLMDDEFYTNSIPVLLFRNLLVSLHICFDEIEPLMIPTFRKILSKETPETIKKKKSGYMLWECEEAVIKYTNHLKELMSKEGQLK